MEWIQAHWVEVSAVLLAVIRVIESVMIEKDNKVGLTLVGVIKQIFKLG